MRAAIYARKSDDNDASVALQANEARAFIDTKGWTLALDSTFEDNDVSGKFFTERNAKGEAKRPGLAQLLAAAKQHPRPFDVLVLRDASRLGREMTETAWLQKDLLQRGLRVFHYLDGKELQLKTPKDKLVANLDHYHNEEYRVQISEWTQKRLRTKHELGHVTNGKLYGYDNVEILKPGKKPGDKDARDHVVRRPNSAQAAVVQRIFSRYGAGVGFRVIARELNREGVPASGKQWFPETLRDMLRNAHYIGTITYGGAQPITRHDEALRLVPQDLWEVVQARLAEAKATYLRTPAGRLQGKPLDTKEGRYLLSGLLQCKCGAPLQARTSNTKYWRCRASFDGTCQNAATITMKRLDAAILSAVQALIEPDVLASYLYPLRLQEPDPQARRQQLQAQLAETERALVKLVEAVVAGGDSVPTLLAALKEHEARKTTLTHALQALAQAPAQPVGDLAEWGQRVLEVAQLGGYVGLARQHPARARQLLRKLLLGRITLTRTPAGLTFSAELTMGPIAGPLGFHTVPAGGRGPAAPPLPRAGSPAPARGASPAAGPRGAAPSLRGRSRSGRSGAAARPRRPAGSRCGARALPRAPAAALPP